MLKPFYDISNIVGSSYFLADINRLAEYSIDSSIPKAVVFPDSEDQIAEILKICSAENISISPMGGNTKSYYGNIPKRLDLIISTKRLNTFIQHDIEDFIATAQSGISLEDFQKSIHKSNQYLALDPPLLDKGCTLGGLISTNDYGPSRHRFNGIKENLLSLRIVRADGKKVKGGAKVVKNVAGYDIPKLLIGSFGTLGIITEATFRLYPIPEQSRTLLIYLRNLSLLTELSNTVLNSDFVLTSIEFVNKNVIKEHNSYLLALKVENLEQAVRQQIIELKEILSKFKIENLEILTGKKEKDLWHKLINFPYQINRSNILIVKIRVPIINLIDIFDEFEKQNNESGTIIKATGSVGLGIISASLENNKDILKRHIHDLNDKITSVGGNISITSMPKELKENFDIFGYIEPAVLSIMKIMKNKFDPNNILNPGRYIGGI